MIDVMSACHEPLPPRRSATKQHQATPVSMADLAAHLGLALSTVSDALRGTGRVAETTRQRVRRAADDLGYRPDPLMSAFSRRRKRNAVFRGAVIASILAEPTDPSGILSNEDAEPMGYHLDTFYLSQYPSQSALARVLRQRGIVSVIFPEIAKPILLENDVWKDFIGAYCGPYPGEGCPFDVIRYNAFDTVRMAWARAVNAGYQRIGLLYGHHPAGLSSLDRKSLAAFRECQESASPQLARLSPMIREIPSILEIEEPLREWLALNKPDAVIGGFSALYLALQRTAGNKGVTPPFIAIRGGKTTSPLSNVAGYTVSRAFTERMALRHLDALTRAGARSQGQSRVNLVIEPSWMPGASWPEPASSEPERT